MDIGRMLKAISSLLPLSRAANTYEGAAVDCAGGGREVLAVLYAGTNEATGTLDVKIQESADNSTWTDITGAAFTQITTANDNAIYQGRIAMTPTRKRYLRAYGTQAAAAGVAAVLFVLGDAPYGPYGSPVFDVHT